MRTKTVRLSYGNKIRIYLSHCPAYLKHDICRFKFKVFIKSSEENKTLILVKQRKGKTISHCESIRDSSFEVWGLHLNTQNFTPLKSALGFKGKQSDHFNTLNVFVVENPPLRHKCVVNYALNSLDTSIGFHTAPTLVRRLRKYTR